MDVNVEMPDEIDLGAFRGHGKQPNEKLFPARSTGLSLSQSVPDIDLEVVNQVCFCGFDLIKKKKIARNYRKP